MSARALRVATRASPLARWQAGHVIGLLRVPVEPVFVETSGDRLRDVSLASIGGQGVFVKEVQTAVLEGRADFAVHSAKDLPGQSASGLVLAAIPERGDPRDALVGSPLAALTTGARVATGAVRRRAQLAHVRPDLTFAELRGNIGTRLAKASEFDAIVVAVAALERLGLTEHIAEALDPVAFVPQVGQGALAVECRADDEELIAMLAAIEHVPSRRAVDAERAMLAEMGGGCTLPIGAHARAGDGEEALTLTGLVASDDGRVLLRHTAQGRDPSALGRTVAIELLDHLGGRELLELAAGR